MLLVLTIAMTSAARYLLLERANFSIGSNSVSFTGLSSILGFDNQQSKIYQLVAGSIYDGDTLRVTDGVEELKIRLCGIDAPEKEQPMGMEARDHLSSLIAKGDGSIIVVPVEQDRYGRTVAELFIKPRSGQGYQAGEEIAVNAQMVVDGYAYHYDRYSGNCPNGQVLSRLEANASQQGLGVWRDPQAVRPWDYRKSN